MSKDRAGKHRAKDVNEQVGQRSFEHSGQIVAVCKPHKHRGENHHSHDGKEKIVEAPNW
jgi:hypothetical protein